jgi:uncharacterized membrane protein YiaA
MKQWTRWQDWVALVAGVYAFLSPIWTETTTTATWTMIVLGVVTALVSLWSLAMPDNIASEGAHAVLGVLLFIAPWVMAFADVDAMAWTAWVVGVVTFVVGLWALPESQKLHRGVATSH